METKNTSLNKILSLLTDNMDKEINVYIGDTNIKYQYTRQKEKDSCYTHIDILDTNGTIFEDDENSCIVQDSDYVVIKTLNNRELENINMILSFETYGRVSAELLRESNEPLYVKFNSSTKGMLENYQNIDRKNCFYIEPILEETKQKVRSI